MSTLLHHPRPFSFLQDPNNENHDQIFIDLVSESEDDDIFDYAPTTDDTRIPFGHSDTTDELVMINDETWLQLEPDMTVELIDNSFLRIVAFIKFGQDVKLLGILLKRASDIKLGYRPGDDTTLATILQLPSNVVGAMVRVEDGLPSTGIQDDLVERSPIQIKRLSKVTFTNLDNDALNQKTTHVNNELVCALKYIAEIQGNTKDFRCRGVKLLPLEYKECDPGYGVQDHMKLRNFELAKRWQLYERKRVSSPPRKRRKTSELGDKVIDLDVIDLTHENKIEIPLNGQRNHQFAKQTALTQSFRVEKLVNETRPKPRLHVFERVDGRRTRRPQRSRRKLYYYCDYFSGPGGAALGAQLADLAVKSVVDHDPAACETLRMNFPGARVHRMDITEYIKNKDVIPEGVSIDIIHVSFPCKGFSALNRGLNPARDEMHRDLAYGLLDLIEKTLPRIVTLEQVPGIFRSDKGEGKHFYEQLWALWKFGYSIQFKTLNFANYGVPQARKRLMVIAACAGQKMPPWPKPTHGDNVPGLKPIVTIREALSGLTPSGICPGVDDPNGMMAHCVARLEPRRSADKPLTELIACGNPITHPNGNRTLTPREKACCQTFPREYRFGGKTVGDVVRQIGDAVPPIFSRAMNEQIVKTLRETDEENARMAGLDV